MAAVPVCCGSYGADDEDEVVDNVERVEVEEVEVEVEVVRDDEVVVDPLDETVPTTQ